MTATKWPEVALGDVATIERNVRSPEDIESGCAYIGLEDIESGGRRITKQLVEPGDLASAKFEFTEQHILYGKLRPYLAKIAMPDFAGVCSTDIVPILPGSQIDRSYLCHFLRQRRMVDLATSRSSGANLPRLSPSELSSFPVPLPPIAEQRRIAAMLDLADALRAKRRQSVALLGSLAETIFLEMFGDPVANPRRWPEGTLGDLLTFQQYGHRFYDEAYSDEGVRTARITDLNDAGELDFSAMPRMALTPEEQQKYLLRSGDLIFARSGATVGKVALIRPSDPPCIAGAYFITMRFDARIDPEYALAVLGSRSIRALVTRQSRQAAQQNFSGPALRRLPLPVPPPHLQSQFVARMRDLAGHKSKTRRSAERLDELFAALQQRAFRGEL